MSVFDLVVIGGGINGAGIARDAAGRGLSVLLCDKGDLAEGTSSRSGKLIHGGLRYLEYYEFRLVREALIEREVLLRAAPHIIWPMRFVLPHSPEQRPAWLIRLGLFLYDHLGGRRLLPATRVVDLARDAVGQPIREAYRKGFEYSDCWVDDARLVILNAIDARARGAEILPRTKARGARRVRGVWEVELEDRHGSRYRTVSARALVNAAGPWVERVLGEIQGAESRRRVRLVKGSHIVTPRFWDGEHAYLLQNTDKRVIFVNPYEGDLALIGTTDIPVEGEPGDARIDEREIDYLLDVVGRYFRHPPARADVLHSFSGVRPLYDDSAANPSAVTRDYIFEVDPPGPRAGEAPILSIFGGKITTYRKLAEHALERLKPFFPAAGPAWTARAALPGGDIANADFAAWLENFRATRPWLPPALARHYGRLYGTRAQLLLGDAERLDDLGRHFGGLLYEREALFLMSEEWAETAEDILDRRTKHGLHLDTTARKEFADWLVQASGSARRLTA
ncbi:MAG: D-erythritol 1-phosphate dehydrogenase [Rhodospirillaceae bacterium]|jgi:glycerol-3-phosphate dehydrogenase|nr:D-erythritol 1-phosphate dehydrogenase [Rhodospirillaceae bacterium]